MRISFPCLLTVLIVPAPMLAADKPRDRASAESKADNLARYKLGGFGANANATLYSARSGLAQIGGN